MPFIDLNDLSQFPMANYLYCRFALNAFELIPYICNLHTICNSSYRPDAVYELLRTNVRYRGFPTLP